MSRKSFILHLDSLEVLSELTDEQAGQLFKAIKDHGNNKPVRLSGLLKAVFVPFKKQLDGEKYGH